MADALITYEIVIATFLSLTGLLFAVRRKYNKTRLAKNFESVKTKIDWMKTRK
ncbi:MAG TPA: hypothetical protein VH481_03605 [Nitrososphaeraceae archaeon]